MPTSTNTGTRDIPLRFAATLTQVVNDCWSSGSLLNQVTPVTRELLTYWFAEPFEQTRNVHFHDGQRQAILNAVYAHEVVRSASVRDLYLAVAPDLLAEMSPDSVLKNKYDHPKYCIKMATGTGKTWVLHALLLWQLLNSRHTENPPSRYSSNFLIVTPGLIVYDRMLDAYLGKQRVDGTRDIATSDLVQFQDLLVPPAYREEVSSFVQANLVRKEDIGRKTTGDGIIAITNWHVLVDDTPDESPVNDTFAAIRELLPLTPGTSDGHTLTTLDSRYLAGGELEYLSRLDCLTVFNDEAHHIHETKTGGIVSEVEWQKSLNRLADGKGDHFLQIDFSATPYDVTGSGQHRTKNYFPHIVVDFDLKSAIQKGLVKIITLDRRKEVASMDLDFRAMRDDTGRTIGLSEGQRLMLRAGLQKLNILEEQFVTISKDANGVSSKHPKMLVICEDTSVTPFVVDFLVNEGLTDEGVLRVDSDEKGQVSAKEWLQIKQRLFGIDHKDNPRVIVSVLMLREGFDVNNICVIVPLRSSQQPILLEQILGRGLRLMWREPELQEVKQQNLIRVLKRKEAPLNYLDILSIVEHPAFIQFYDELAQDDLIGQTEDPPVGRAGVLGDIMEVGLKADFAEYDLAWPVVIQEEEETLKVLEPSGDYFSKFTYYSLDQLKSMLGKKGDAFYSEEMTVKTRFGDYRVSGSVFTVQSYNEFLSKLVDTVTTLIQNVSARKLKQFPALQINQALLVRIADDFIKTKLFGGPFDPLEDDNWRVLLIAKSGITEHLVTQFSRLIYETQRSVDVEKAVVSHHLFSEVPSLRVRESFSVPYVKTIYERLPYPSNRGELEHSFMDYCDTDSLVTAFVKISEVYHWFARLLYVRTDGILANYYPDFVVKTADCLYLVETKAQRDLRDENVGQKMRAALDWLGTINQLDADDREQRQWKYCLLGENLYHTMKKNGASIPEILDVAALTEQSLTEIKGSLF
jgi:type III restriction enzyme